MNLTGRCQVMTRYKFVQQLSVTAFCSFFFATSKFLGLNTFVYPSKKFKHSTLGFLCFLGSLFFWVYLCWLSWIDLRNHNLSKKVTSKVMLIGIQMVDLVIAFTLSLCLLINFARKKFIFQAAKLLEHFDENVSWTDSSSQFNHPENFR